MSKLENTHWTVIAELTGIVNESGHYVPAGLHRCQMCQTYNDPRRISVGLPEYRGFSICVDCGAEYLLPLLLELFTKEELFGVDQEGGYLTKYPRNPYAKKEKIPLTERPFEKIKARIEATEPGTSQEDRPIEETQQGG